MTEEPIDRDRFELLSRATNDALWDLDLERDLLWWSEGIERLAGVPRAMLDPSSASWTALIHPEDRPRVLSEFHEALSGYAAGWVLEYRMVDPAGVVRWVEDRFRILRDGSGRAVRVLGGITDVTAEREREAALAEQAALLDLASDAIMVRSLDGRLTYWNPGAARIYGHSAAEALGASVEEIILDHPMPDRAGDPVAASAHAFAQVLRDGEWSGQLGHRTRDGRAILLDARWSLVRDSRGEPRAVLAIHTDVTERHRIEQEFLRAQRLESIGALVGGIAHDLNNVLAPILMVTELLHADETDPARRELLRTARVSASRGADLVSRVLAFARGAEVTRDLVDVGALLDEVAALVRDTFPKRITVALERAGTLPGLLGDATQLHQVLLNLCVNARDAIRDTGTLRIGAEAVERDGQGWIRVEVADTGVGMPAEVQARIGDPFFTTKAPGQGTGLGLPTVFSIIRGHGGRWEVTSEVGVGTEFAVWLPAAVAVEAQDRPERAEASAVAGPPSGAGERILVVDDEAPIRRLVASTLEAFGYQVTTAESGRIALEHLEDDPSVHVLLTDLSMPEMDGAALVRAMRDRSIDLPVVLMSGRSDLDEADLGLETDGPALRVRVLAKPFSAVALLGAIAEVL